MRVHRRDAEDAEKKSTGEKRFISSRNSFSQGELCKFRQVLPENTPKTFHNFRNSPSEAVKSASRPMIPRT